MWRYSRLKAKPRWTKKKLLEKVEKLHFSQQGARLVHGFGQKFEYVNFHHFILGKIKKENVFHDILDRRTAFRTTETST